MKKTTALLCILVCLLLSACDPVSFYFDSEELSQKAVSIELINYDNDIQSHFHTWVPNYFDRLKSYDVANESLLETLDETRVSESIEQLSKDHILYRYYAYDSPKGVCIKITYVEGNYLIIWSNYEQRSYSGYIGEYSANGEVVDFFGCFSNLASYENLVNGYFYYKV